MLFCQELPYHKDQKNLVTEITKTNPNYSGPKEMTDEWNTDENINNRNFLSYRDLDLGIEIEYPTNWAIEQTREDSIIFRSPLRGYK